MFPEVEGDRAGHGQDDDQQGRHGGVDEEPGRTTCR